MLLDLELRQNDLQNLLAPLKLSELLLLEKLE